MKRVFSVLLTISLILTLSGCGTKKEEPVIKDEINGYSRYMLGYEFIFKDMDSLVIDDDYHFPDSRSEIDQFISSLDETSYNEKIDFNSVIKEINDNKYRLAKENRIDLGCDQLRSKYYGDLNYRDGEGGVYSDSELKELANPKKKKTGNMTIEQAITDAKVYEKYLRSVYGAYKYWGKDRMLEAHNKAVELIKLEKEPISSERLLDILLESYYFINDHHFDLDFEGHGEFRDRVEGQYIGFCYDDYYFLKDDKGYFLKDYSPKTYLTSVNGETNLEDKLHYSVDNNGELVYMISFMDKNLFNGNIKISLGNQEFDIKLDKMKGAIDFRYFYKIPNYELVAFTNEEGYPVISTRTYSTRDVKALYKHSLAARACSKENIVIYDTRNNGGGRGVYYIDFYDSLMEKDIDKEEYTRYLKNNLKGNQYINRALVNTYGNVRKLDNLLFTLTDFNSGSSGEGVVHESNILENAIVIGEPTNGTMIAGEVCRIFLPNSKIECAAGTHIKYRYGFDHIPDGKGIKPDIWIKSNEALDKAIALAKHYNINPSNKVSQIVDEYGFGSNDFARTNLNKLIKEKYIDDSYTIKYTLTASDGKNYDDNIGRFIITKKTINNRTNRVVKEETIIDNEKIIEGEVSLEDNKLIIRKVN